jgi:hypothetical protein
MGRLSTLESATNCGQAWDSAEPVARVPGQRVIISIVTLATLPVAAVFLKPE